MLPTKFWFIWESDFKGEDFIEINQSETKIVCGGHVCQRIGMKLAIFTEDLPKMLPTKFRFIWPNSFRGKEFKKSANQKQESPVVSCNNVAPVTNLCLGIATTRSHSSQSCS